jgi:hypothetical protein
MLQFKYVHIYCNQVNTLEFVNVIVPGVRKYFRNITIDMRRPFLTNMDDVIVENLVSIRISDTRSLITNNLKSKNRSRTFFMKRIFRDP